MIQESGKDSLGNDFVLITKTKDQTLFLQIPKRGDWGISVKLCRLTPHLELAFRINQFSVAAVAAQFHDFSIISIDDALVRIVMES